MTEDLESALAWCLEALENQRLTISECLARYPEHQAELQELLSLAMAVSHAPDVQPSLEFKLHARTRLVRQLTPRPSTPGTLLRRSRVSRESKPKQRMRMRPAMSWLVITVLVLSLFAGGGLGVAYAADGSVPGDMLYGLDTTIESTRLALALDEEGKAQLALQFALERLKEMQDLAARGGSEENFNQAVDGYDEMVYIATEALTAIAASGQSERVAALGALIQTSLSIHGEILEDVMDQVPEAAKSHINRAKSVSERGNAVVDELFSRGMPGRLPGEIPIDRPEEEEVPGERPEEEMPDWLPIDIPPGGLTEDIPVTPPLDGE